MGRTRPKGLYMHNLPFAASGEAYKPELLIVIALSGLALALLFAAVVGFALAVKFSKRSFNLLAWGAFLLTTALVFSGVFALITYLNASDPYADSPSWLVYVALGLLVASVLFGAFGIVRFVGKTLRTRSAS